MYNYVSGALIRYRSPESASFRGLHLFLGLLAIRQSSPPQMSHSLKDQRKIRSWWRPGFSAQTWFCSDDRICIDDPCG